MSRIVAHNRLSDFFIRHFAAAVPLLETGRLGYHPQGPLLWRGGAISAGAVIPSPFPPGVTPSESLYPPLRWPAAVPLAVLPAEEPQPLLPCPLICKLPRW